MIRRYINPSYRVMGTSPAPTVAWSQHKYHPEQYRLATSTKKFAYVTAGRGSGKTEIAKRRLVAYLAVKKPWDDPRYFYAAPTYAQAKRIAWHSILRLIPTEWIAANGIDRSELCIRTIFGSELWVVGLDRPQRIEGVQWDGGVMDESCDIRPKTFDLSVLPALLHRNAWCWRIGVPKRFGIGAAEFRKAWMKARKGELEDSDGYTWSGEDILPPDALKMIKSMVDQKDYDEQIRAKFVSTAGGIFYAFDEDRNVRPCTYDPSKPILVGSDFNVDPMCWVIAQRHGPGDVDTDWLEVMDEIWLRDTNTPATLDVLWDRYHTHKSGFEFYGDATGKARKSSASISDYMHIRNDWRFLDGGRVVRYLKSNPPKADRFAACNGLICSADDTRRLYIDTRCKHLIDEMTSRTFKPGTSIPDDSDLDVGHITDALGYLVYKQFPIRLRLTNQYEVAITGA